MYSRLMNKQPQREDTEENEGEKEEIEDRRSDH